MASPNATFTELVTTTLRNHKPEVVDNVSDHNALTRYLKDKGHIETESGGTEITRPLSYAENSTYQRFSGYDALNVQASDVLSAASYAWKQAAIHVTASGRELLINNGKEKLIGLVKARIKVAMATAANNMSVDVYSDGALSNQIGGLAHIVTNDGTGTVGGINSGNYPFWANQFKEMAGTGTFSKSTIKGEMNALWMRCVRGTDKPDLIVASHDVFAVYEESLQDLQRYTSAKAAAAGFEALKYKSADIIFDSNTNFGTTAEKAFFLNTDHLFIVEHPEAQWSQDDEKVPTNQHAVVIPLYWMGQVVCTNRSLQGVLIDVS
jgi:hypothetical protein